MWTNEIQFFPYRLLGIIELQNAIYIFLYRYDKLYETYLQSLKITIGGFILGMAIKSASKESMRSVITL